MSNYSRNCLLTLRSLGSKPSHLGTPVQMKLVPSRRNSARGRRRNSRGCVTWQAVRPGLTRNGESGGFGVKPAGLRGRLWLRGRSVRAPLRRANERIIEGIARWWLSEHSAGPPRTRRTSPERQILLFHGIVNSRQRVLMPVPSRGGTHEISVLRLSSGSSVLLRAVIHRRASHRTPYFVIDGWSVAHEGDVRCKGRRIRDDSAVKKFRREALQKRDVYRDTFCNVFLPLCVFLRVIKITKELNWGLEVKEKKIE